MSRGQTHSDHHSHQHDSKMLGRAFLLIAGFMTVELVAGLMTNALVLLADAGHMFLDATALGLSWWAARISAKGFDQNLSYGYHRFQVLAAFINGLTLVALVVWIAIEAVTRIANPEPILPLPALAVAVLGLLINLIAFRWLHGTSGNTNVRSAMLHVLGDILGSVAAIVAALLVYFLGWIYADPALALVIIVILGRGAYRVLKESTYILLEGVPQNLDVTEIKRSLCANIPQVQDVHHVHAWALTAEKPLLTLHAQVPENTQVQSVVADIKVVLSRDFGIAHSTIQVETGPCPDDH